MDAAAAELRRLHAENERLAALVEAQQPAPLAAGRVKLPEPDTAETAPWTGWKVKYHSPDQIIGYGNQQFNAGRQFEVERLAALWAPQPSPAPQAGSVLEGASLRGRLIWSRAYQAAWRDGFNHATHNA